MKSIITVVGRDQVGLIASVCRLLAEKDVNVFYIDQSIKEGYFNMFMIVRLKDQGSNFKAISDSLNKLSKEIGVEITIQRTELFDEMYKISRSGLWFVQMMFLKLKVWLSIKI